MATRNKSPTKAQPSKPDVPLSPTKGKQTKADISSSTASIAAKAKALKKVNSPTKEMPADQPKEDFIKCGICKHTLKNPKTLRCLHSFCKKCLLTHVSGEKSSKTSLDIVCPICSQINTSSKHAKTVAESVELLPANEFLSSYLEAVSLRDPDKACDTCMRQGRSSEAVRWCSTCHDALCEECVGFHNALKATKQHHIVLLDELRKQPLNETISVPLCHIHAGENVTKYCENHRQVICDKCVAGSHKDCKAVKTLKEAVTKAQPDISHINKLLEEETRLAKSIQESRTKAEKGLDEHQTSILHKIQEVRKRINENLAKCEHQIIDELNNIHGKEKSVYQAESKEAQEIRKSSGNIKALAESTEKYGADSHQLTNLPDTAAQSEHYKGKLASLNSRIKNTNIDFVVDSTLGSLMQGISRLGELRVTSSSAKLPTSRALKADKSDSDPEDEIDMMGSTRTLKSDSKSLKSMKSLRSSTMYANLMETVNVKSPSDTESCWFTGIACLQNGQFILVDRNNNKLKVISSDFKIVTETQLEHQPFGITTVSASQIAVTVPRENRIDIFTVGASLTHSESISIADRGYGITFTGDRFIVVCSCASPPSIKVISLSGEEKQELNPEDNYHPMFFRPWYVKTDTSGSKMYVSDCHRSHVTCISGTVMKQFVYKDNSLNSPRGLHVTKDGRVVVCGFGSDNIQVLDKDGGHIADLLTRSDDVMGPQDVALNAAEDKMLLTFDPSSGRSDFLHVYGVHF